MSKLMDMVYSQNKPFDVCDVLSDECLVVEDDTQSLRDILLSNLPLDDVFVTSPDGDDYSDEINDDELDAEVEDLTDFEPFPEVSRTIRQKEQDGDVLEHSIKASKQSDKSTNSSETIEDVSEDEIRS